MAKRASPLRERVKNYQKIINNDKTKILGHMVAPLHLKGLSHEIDFDNIDKN